MRVIRVPNSGFNPLLQWEFEESPTNCGRIVCFNEQEITVIRKGLQSLRWPTRYGNYLNDKMFQLSDNADVIACIDEIEVKMSCNDIADSITSLGQSIKDGLLAIANKPCCDDGIPPGTSPVVGTTPEGNIEYGTEPPGEAPTELPEGYTDSEQYEAQKCGIANALVSGIIFALQAMTTITGVNAIAVTLGLILAAIPFAPVAPVLIPVLVPLVAVAWLASGTLYALSLEVENHRQDLVCAMMTGDNVENIIDGIAEVIDVIIAAVPLTGTVAVACKSILLIFFSTDSLNRLYAAYAGFMYPEADCSDCDTLAWYSPNATEITYNSITQVYSVIAMQVSDDVYRADIVVTSNCQVITEFSITGYEYDPTPAGYSQFELCDHSVNALIDPDIELSDFDGYDIFALALWSIGGPFSFTLKSEDSI